MTKSGRTAVAGVASALCVVILLLGNFLPDMTLSVSAISAVIVFFIAIEFGFRLAVGVYAASAILSMLLVTAQPSVFWLYTLIFGLFSLIKKPIDKIAVKPLRFTVKIVFSAVTLAAYAAVAVYVLSSADMLDILSGQPLMIAAAFLLYELAFVLYDICLTRLAGMYIHKWRQRIFGK